MTMKKRVPVEDLKLGMLVVGMDKPWEESPFLRHELRIHNDQQIEKIRGCGVRFVDIQEESACAAPLVSDPDPPEPELPQPVSHDEELVRAKAIYLSAKSIIQDSMHDVRMGQEINLVAVNDVVGEMVESLVRNRDSLTSLTRLKSFDEYTFYHSVNVGVLATSLGHHRGVEGDDLIRLGAGALLHDIGKVVIPVEILNKPGKFTKEEFEVMKRHPEAGAEILGKTTGAAHDTILPCLEHQERGDGKGYPYGKTLPEMSVNGLITQIADVYDAITSERVYHKAKPPYEVLRYLYTLGQKGELDVTIVQQFIQCVGIYPVGSFVELNTGERGIVLSLPPSGLLAPRVLIIFDQKGPVLPPCPVVDLSASDLEPQRTIKLVLDPAAYGVNPAAYLDSQPIPQS
jgi:HD-GYP domain-containing protein (c-di-GMP phosphodiesterase class II)